jgi:hypothetical protein
MLRLGLLLLTALLLGLPRALRGTSPHPASVYVAVEPGDATLTAFGAAVEAELEREHFTPASRPTRETLIVEIHSGARLVATEGASREAVRVTVRERGRTQRLVLDFDEANMQVAARTLIASLPTTHGHES